MRPFPLLFGFLLAITATLFALHGCGGEPKPCDPPCGDEDSCVDGKCVTTCVQAECGYDGICLDGGCARAHPGVTCPAAQLIAGGLVGPPSPPSSCQRSARPTTLSAAQVIPLGTHGVGETVSFMLPPDLAGFSIVSQAVSATDAINLDGEDLDNSVVPDKVLGPDGATWFDDFVVPADYETAFYRYGGYSPVVGFMTIPNTERSLNIAGNGGLPQGTWRFVVNDYAYECLSISGCDGGTDAGEYDLQVLMRPGPAPTTATLDLSIYLVETNGLTSGTAVSDPHVARFARSLTTLLAQQGVCPGKITFHDVPQWATTRYADSIDVGLSGPCDPLSQMFTLSQPGSTLNLFFVTALGGGSGMVIGVDGTIPGPSTIGGTIHSGAAVSTADLRAGTCGNAFAYGACGADSVALIAAHEAGHWLGLFHTTDRTGSRFDPLGDTPRCACQSCLPSSATPRCGASQNPALISNAFCLDASASCGGGNNLMFPFARPENIGLLTADQGDVMRRNLLMR